MLKFRKVAIVRHGSTDEHGRINAEGEKQMGVLTSLLRSLFEGEENILFISSSAPRAEDCAKFISGYMDVPYETTPDLWCDNRHAANTERAAKTVEERATEKKADVAIILTHMEYANELPEILEQHAGKDFIEDVVLNKGQMLFIDFEKRKCKKYPVMD